MPGPQSKYAWPASKLTDDDMYVLYVAREQAPTKTTISCLLAQAVRQTFGRVADNPQPNQQKEAA